LKFDRVPVAEPTTTAYYERFGFVVREVDHSNPLMILPIWSVNDLFGGR